MTEISIHMRIQKAKAERVVAEFVRLGFIDEDPTTKQLMIHGWKKRQFKSDDVTARTEAFRERSRERSENGSAHVRGIPETETDTEKNKQKVRVLVGSVGPEYKPIAELAESLTADPSWCMWVSRMARLGYAADWIDYTLRTLAGKNQLKQQIAAGMLKNLAADGGPPKQSRNGVMPKPKPVQVTAEEKAAAKAEQEVSEARIRELEAGKKWTSKTR